MNEHDALAVSAVRAIESADRERTLWSDADRAWASRAAAEVVGEKGTPEAFVARRARLAMERLGERYPPLRKAISALRWRRWIGIALVGSAFVFGVVVDRLDGQVINLLAPPLLGVLAWNLVVYLLLLLSPVLGLAGAHDFRNGPLRRAIARVAGGIDRVPRREAKGPLGQAIGAFLRDWSARAGPIYTARAARILHWSAAAVAAGILAGLYLRGLAFEYRVTWQSTFLDAPTVHRILSVMLMPGSWVTGIPMPGVEALEALRSTSGPASSNAAPWLHLIAATVALVVIAPRLLLGALAWIVERHRRSHVDVALAEPYHQRVLRGFHGGPVRVKVIPYSYRVPPQALSGLQAIVRRTFGGSASLVVSSPVEYGSEDAMTPATLPDGAGPAFALFNLAATPEREAHVQFVQRLEAASSTQPVIVLIDESGFVARGDVDAARLEERRAAWRAQLAGQGREPVFVNLDAPDLPQVESALESRLVGAP
jgi:hypothetical protein